MLPIFLFDIREFFLDILIGGQSLSGRFQTPFVETYDANEVQSTDYRLIKKIIASVPLEKDQCIADIGCGMGRFIGYLSLKGFSGPLVGLEIDPDYAAFCSWRFRKNKKIQIINADAVTATLPDGCIAYLYNPFKQSILEKFLQSKKNIRRIVYCNDEYRKALEMSPDWVLFKEIDACLDDGTPVHVSVWDQKA